MTFTLAGTVHIVFHAVIPLVIALLFWRKRWKHAFIVMFATMLVDLDHLLADPIYDPNRCSIGFHPLHTAPAIGAYVLLTVPGATRLVGLGLTTHMLWDAADCVRQGTL